MYLHHQKLKEIKARKVFDLDSKNQEHLLKQLSKSKRASQQIYKHHFDDDVKTTHNLVNHIIQIQTRKSESYSHLRKFKSSIINQEKKNIYEENKRLMLKQAESKKYVMTK
eukprot:GHVR01019602.1.p1 GENE.GHVR01019602.1~~GHVR01019602.1.p1  ORF type:complete len:111 (+),score=6.17 GHVR01019602.1:2431-2763(+)